MKLIGIQGAKGSFSEIAAQQFSKTHHIDEFSIEYLISSKNVLNAIENKATDLVFSLWKMRKVVLLSNVLKH